MNRRAVGWILLGVVGLYCLWLAALGRVAFAYGYRPDVHSLIMFIRYFQPVLVLPFFLVSLLPRKWATLPLWLVCLSISSFPFLIRDANVRALLGYSETPSGLRMVKEFAIVMAIPVIVQTAVWLKSKQHAKA